MSTKIAKRDPVTIERTLTTVPVRSAEETSNLLISLMGETLHARQFAARDAVGQALGRLQPMIAYLVVIHALEEGAVLFDTEDLCLRFSLQYEQTAPDESRALPAFEAMGTMSAETQITLTFCMKTSLSACPYADVVRAINAGKVMLVEFLNQDCKPCANEAGDLKSEVQVTGEPEFVPSLKDTTDATSVSMSAHDKSNAEEVDHGNS